MGNARAGSKSCVPSMMVRLYATPSVALTAGMEPMGVSAAAIWLEAAMTAAVESEVRMMGEVFVLEEKNEVTWVRLSG